MNGRPQQWLGFALGLLVFMSGLVVSGLLSGLSTRRLCNRWEVVSSPGRGLTSLFPPPGNPLGSSGLGLMASSPRPVPGLLFMALPITPTIFLQSTLLQTGITSIFQVKLHQIPPLPPYCVQTPSGTASGRRSAQLSVLSP